MSLIRQKATKSIGFAPIAKNDARILILGSLPGARSIERNEYYAHPRNAFWPIMRVLAGAEGAYEQRCRALMDAGIAVWDVLASSVRPGSLDADIDLATAETNDFQSFFAAHPEISRVCFNGQAAAKIYRKRVQLDRSPTDLQILPSTSPAHAAMTIEQKLELWRTGIGLKKSHG